MPIRRKLKYKNKHPLCWTPCVGNVEVDNKCIELVVNLCWASVSDSLAAFLLFVVFDWQGVGLVISVSMPVFDTSNSSVSLWKVLLNIWVTLFFEFQQNNEIIYKMIMTVALYFCLRTTGNLRQFWFFGLWPSKFLHFSKTGKFCRSIMLSLPSNNFLSVFAQWSLLIY